MSPEDQNRSRVETVNEGIKRMTGIPDNLGRSQRRRLERAARKNRGKSKPPRISAIQPLEEVDDLLLQEDIIICEQELALREYQLESIGINIEMSRALQLVGVSEAAIREFYLNKENNIFSQGALFNLLVNGAKPARIQQQMHRFREISRKSTRMTNRYGNKMVVDAETNALIRSLFENTDLKVEEIFKELLRVENENIDLIKLQIEFLSSKKDEEFTAEEPTPVPDVEPETTEHLSQPYSLAGWNLYWTRSYWSSDENHLSPISTASEQEAVSSLSAIGRGQISVKPASIIRALEFHLGKDIIQRALATRNKYGPQGIRDWVKIKRGDDRIFLFVPHDGKAIFFAAGRDVVYR
jgi:hypothetical protein